MELKRTGNEDRSMQSILKDYVRLKHHAMFIKESGKSNYTTAYCIDFSKTAKSGGTLNADMKIDDTEHFFATQVLIWIIRTGNFYNDANRTKLENYFFKAWPSVKSRYQTIYQKVKYQDMLPSYAGIKVNGQESSCGKFEWDTCTNTYKSGSNSANTTVKVDKSSLPCGVDVQICGEQVKITYLLTLRI